MLRGLNRALAESRLMAGDVSLTRERPSRSCSSGATDIAGGIAAVDSRINNENKAQPASHRKAAAVNAYSVRRNFRSFQADEKNRIQDFQSGNP